RKATPRVAPSRPRTSGRAWARGGGSLRRTRRPSVRRFPQPIHPAGPCIGPFPSLDAQVGRTLASPGDELNTSGAQALPFRHGRKTRHIFGRISLPTTLHLNSL